MTRPLRAAASLAAAALGCFAWGLAEANLFQVRRVSVPVLPAGGRELRVLHISDVHLLESQHAKLDFLRSLAGLAPDVVVNTGDNISSDRAIASLMAALGPLRDVPGGFVFGSNDYHRPEFKSPLRYVTRGRSEASAAPEPLDSEQLRSALTRSGAWHDLNDRRAIVEVGGYRVELRGTDDAHHDRDDYPAVAGPASDGVDLSLGVTHAPYRRVLDAMTVDGVQLILAGHTHGGQVCVPGYGALTTNCDLPTPQVKGLSRHEAGGGSAWLHVSAGIGTSPFAPYRFACPPEVTLLTLTPVS
mgnify:CR=1 FL=1